MASSDSLFLFEIKVEELKSCIDNKLFRIRSQFGDIFKLHLKDPNEVLPEGPMRGKKRKVVIKEAKVPVPSACTVMVSSKINTLALHMEKYPMYLCMWGKGNPYSLGSTHIPWRPDYIDYLESLKRNENPEPVKIKGTYSVFNEYTSKKMATVVLSVKLTRMATNVPSKTSRLTKRSSSFVTFTDDPETNVSRISDTSETEDIGIIKTIYKGGKRLSKPTHSIKKDKIAKKDPSENINVNIEKKEKPSKKEVIETDDESLSEIISKFIELEEPVILPAVTKHIVINKDEINDEMKQEVIKFQDLKDKTQKQIKEEVNIEDIQGKTNKTRIVNLVRSNTEIDIKPNNMIKSKSCSSVEIKERLDILDYIFAEHKGPFGNQVYCVGYCTVKNDNTPSTSPPKTPTTPTTPRQKSLEPSSKSSVASVSKIKSVSCPEEKEAILLDKTKRHGSGKFSFEICKDDCERKAEVGKCFENICSIDLPEEASHMIALRKCTKLLTCPHKTDEGPPPKPEDKILIHLKHFKEKCCEIQKVEEIMGGMKMQMKTDDPCFCTCDCKFGVIRRTTYCAICGGYEIPGEPEATQPTTFPCPIFHKLERKDKKTEKKKKKSDKDKESESDKDDNKKKKRKRDDRFKFNYGYKGIPPQIGHSQCAMPCTGTLGLVPNYMGWLWTAGNIPGLKFRPCWRPGAANKHVVRMLRNARYPEEIAKKRRKLPKPKRPLKRPLLVVEKKDGEYTITMETMKVFNKLRLPNTYPYEDKPLVTFKVGRTDEENAMRARMKARVKRNLEAEQRQFIQGTFRNLCKDICYKTYQQALQMRPGDEDPPCPCLPAQPGPERVDYERTCSCSDQSKSSDATATDDDEWLVEFTPPNALYNPTFKGKKIVKVDRETQYTYLDYQVKLLDRFGTPVPRFFIGPDGKQQCSDLGGFWGPDHKWLEINYDGYIAPDGRWAPYSFIGPNGEQVDADDGKFQAVNGKWLFVGIDGFIENGKWHNYSKPRPMPEKMKKMQSKQSKKAAGDKKHPPLAVTSKVPPSETTWSCFGDADPKELGKMGIVGHAHDRQLLLSTLNQLIKQGDSVVLPETLKIPPRPKTKKKAHKEGDLDEAYDSRKYFTERTKCHHPPPSEKGIQAVDEHGRKTYFRLRDSKNSRPQDRMHALHEKGISLSSFHVPCLNSFINSEVARQQNIEHILRHNARVMKDTAN